MKKLLVLLLILLACSMPIEKKIGLLKFPKASSNTSSELENNKKFQLGRLLFYDGILSADSSISCSSCHSSYNSFAHPGHSLSHGIRELSGDRNAPALINLAWQKTFMWDGAITRLDAQALAPIHHPREMASSLDSVLSRINQKWYYKELFFAATGDSVARTQSFLQALLAFQVQLISNHSKYDSVQDGLSQFSKQEKKGYLLFKQHCKTCHQEPLFTNHQFENNGLAVDPILQDVGRYKITKDPKDSFKFKVPTLRNLKYTHPYMHDGRFKTLQQVIHHYTDGLIRYSNLSVSLQNRIQLSAIEQTDLIAFLLTLNDRDFVYNPMYSFPKKYYFEKITKQ